MGVKECHIEHEKLKKNELTYVFVKLNDTLDDFVVDKTSDSQEIYDCITALPADDARWVLTNYKHDIYGTEEYREMLVTWVPQTSSPDTQMKFSDMTSSIKNILMFMGPSIEANNYDVGSLPERVTAAARRGY